MHKAKTTMRTANKKMKTATNKQLTILSWRRVPTMT
jgi:hypothetical protein